ncbi:hypothetical protein PY650_25365 [Rhizobium calliandrae]|uniref:Uncharacterized protein n=1 Tax=Rhizobium calliandrae TaxID=1312182 RepID=A0ABT7KLU7_9HYPH|nr:hypothetical protein [Rhizobium calliandrae]MDL2408903.1 hypothetical protein [Rhizobium calliandrae]
MTEAHGVRLDYLHQFRAAVMHLQLEAVADHRRLDNNVAFNPFGIRIEKRLSPAKTIRSPSMTPTIIAWYSV